MYASHTYVSKYCCYYTVVVPSSNPYRYFYPFAIHGRWMHWAQNTAESRRTQCQKNMFMSRNAKMANISNSELQRIVNRDGDELKEIVKICKFVMPI